MLWEKHHIEASRLHRRLFAAASDYRYEYFASSIPIVSDSFQLIITFTECAHVVFYLCFVLRTDFASFKTIFNQNSSELKRMRFRS